MARESEICLATSVLQANQIISHLRSAWISPSDISVLLQEHSTSAEPAGARDEPEADGGQWELDSTIETESPLGSLLGNGALSIPGTLHAVAAGPLAGSFEGDPVDDCLFEITRVLVELGLAEFDAQAYEARIGAGEILIVVHGHNSEENTRAKRLLCELGAKEVRTAVASVEADEFAPPPPTTASISRPKHCSVH